MTTPQQVRTTRSRAIAVGGRTVDRDEERVALPIDLLAAAVAGIPRLTAAALVGIDLVDRDLPGMAVRRARRQARQDACRALRLCQRTLETDARNSGYDWRPWVDAAILDTAIALDREAQPGAPAAGGLYHADALAHAVGEAARALAYDRMALPEALCSAQTHALMIVVAAEV